MKSPLRILHVEDSEPDSELIGEMLRRGGIDCEIVRRDTIKDYLVNLKSKKFDLIFADCTLPGFSGLHVLELAREHAPEIPFIFISGTIGEDTAIESLHNGATDYVLKNRLSRLVPAVNRAIEEAAEKAKNLAMEQQLQQAHHLEAVGTLAGGIAHDFNNILTIIKGHASLLNTEGNQPDRVAEIAAIIDHAARRGSDLVNQMLAFARKSEGTFAYTDVNLLLQHVAAMLKEAMPRNISFEFQLDGTLPEILGDSGQIERVVINLCTNARDAMPRGGKIIFATEWFNGDPLSHEPTGGEPYLLLRVTDTGVGMDETTREHIFEPFFTTKPKGKGTGLGLPVVYGLMQSHGGAVDVSSELGKGTSISLYFPLHTNGRLPHQTQKLPEIPRATKGSETILVIDDEPDVVAFLKVMLAAHGYRVLAAGNAEEALELFQAHQDEIDLLFSDFGLPTLDGFELSRLLRSLKPGLKTVLASGYAESIRAKMIDPGVSAFVSKPYTAEAVLHAIRAAMEKDVTSPPTGSL
jgi:two-component system, cell cycle sensor histidine kinase and response regulator CckA